MYSKQTSPLYLPILSILAGHMEEALLDHNPAALPVGDPAVLDLITLQLGRFNLHHVWRKTRWFVRLFPERET